MLEISHVTVPNRAARNALAIVMVFGMVVGSFAFVSSTSAASACPDITGDRFVDLSDLSALAAAIGAYPTTYTANADLNGDGKNDQQDVSIWEGYRGQANFDCNAYLASLAAQSQGTQTIETTPPPQPTPASLSIAKTDNKTSATPGETTTYTITVSNAGDADAVGVMVTDTLPGNYANVTGISDGGSIVGNTLTWNNLTVIGKGSRSVSFKGTIASSLAVGTTTLTNTAKLGCTNAVTCPYSGIATDATTVTVTPVPVPAIPSLKLSKSVNVSTYAAPGDTITYSVTLANDSSATEAARGVMLTDTLPAGFTFKVDGSTSSVFSMGDITPGQTRTLTYDVVIGKEQASGSYNNVVAVKGSNTEQLTATAPVEVRAPIVLGEAFEEPAATASTPKVQVLAETGPGLTDYLIGFGALLSVLGSALLFRRRFAAKA